jgi:dUTP pyrophosphatase
MTEIKMKRRKFYKEGEFVWVKADKLEAEVLSIDTKALTATIKIIVDALTHTVKTLPLWEITKLRKKVIRLSLKTRKPDEILFAKVNPEAIIPSKRDEDGCYDLYACFEEDQIAIQPGECVLIPLGIASAFSLKFRVELRERGSTGINCMARRAGQIDSGYRGEWFFPLNNTSNRLIVISKALKDKPVVHQEGLFYPYNKAIGQAALEFVPVTTVKEVSYEELKSITSERGTGALGSSGK